MATGFNRNHMINFEGGAIPEEYQVEYVVDRVGDDVERLHGPDHGLRALPRPQVRPDHAEGVLPVLRLLQHRAGEGSTAGPATPQPFLQLPTPEQEARARRSRPPRSRRTKPALDDGSRRTDAGARGRSDARRRRPRTIGANGLVAHYELDGSLADISGHYLQRPYRHGRSHVRCRPDREGRVLRRRHRRSPSGTWAHSIAAIRSALALWVKGRAATADVDPRRSSTTAMHRRGFEWAFEDIALVGIQRWAAKLTVTLASEPASTIQVGRVNGCASATGITSRSLTTAPARPPAFALYVDGKPAAAEVVRDTLAGPRDDRRPAAASASKDLGQAVHGSARRSAPSTTAC